MVIGDVVIHLASSRFFCSTGHFGYFWEESRDRCAAYLNARACSSRLFAAA